MLFTLCIIGVACAGSLDVKKYEDMDNITVKVIDGDKIVEVNCPYNESHKQYIGHESQNGKNYSVIIIYEERDGMQGGKMGWWTSASDAGRTDGAHTGSVHSTDRPVTEVEIS